MIVIKPKYHKIKYCYGGSGIIDVLKKIINKSTSSAIAQKVVNTATKDGLKKIINTTANSAITHKLANSVVNGVTSATEKAVENAIIDTLKRKPTETIKKNAKKMKIDISNLVNGSGIVLD